MSLLRLFALPLLLALWSLHSNASNNGSKPKEITVAITNAPPYEVVTKQQPAQALILDILEHIGDSLNFVIKPIECPLPRCLRLLQKGNIDAVGNLMLTPERAKFLEYIQPAYMELHSSFIFYRLTDRPIDINRYEDLYGKRIAVTRGGAYFDRFNNDDKLVKVEVLDQTQTYDMLFNYRVDVVIAIEETAEHSNKLLSRDLAKLKKLDYRFDELILGYMAFSKAFDDQALLSRIKAKMIEYRNDGTLTKLVAKYNLPPITKNK